VIGLAGTFHRRRRSPLVENMFLQAGSGDENTKEKSPCSALHALEGVCGFRV
jgi:hypothetical protein